MAFDWSPHLRTLYTTPTWYAQGGMGGGETSFERPQDQMIWDAGFGGMSSIPAQYTESQVLPESFWQQAAPQGLTARDVVSKIIEQYGAGAQAGGILGRLGNAGYFNQFSDWPEISQMVGDFTANAQKTMDFGPEGVLKANYIHLGNAVDDITHGKLPIGNSTTIFGAPSDETNQEIASRGADPGPNTLLHKIAAMAALAGVGSYLGGGGGIDQGASASSYAGASGSGTAGGAAPSGGGIDWANTYASAGDTGVTSDATLADGGQFTGGFTGNVQGSPGFTGTSLGDPGLSTKFVAEGTALSPSYFPATASSGLEYGNARLTSSGYQPDPGLTTVSASSPSGLLSNPQVIGGALGAGAALLGSNSSGNKGTIQTEEGIPDWLMPYVQPTLSKYATDIQNYNVDPYGIMPSAMQEFKNTVGGMYLDPSTNKYLEDYFRLGSERIRGQLSPSFGHMQAFGQHSGYNEALARGLGDYAVGLYGGAYEKERARQNQMVAASPAFLGQNTAAQFSPYTEYLKAIGSLGKSKETPYFTNPWGSILGGAMVGSQIGKAFG